MKRIVWALAASLLLIGSVQSTIIYDESVDGDMVFSGNGSNTILTLVGGTNTIIGSVAPGDSDDFIFFGAGLDVSGGTFTALYSGNNNGNYNSNAIPILPTGTFQGVISGNTTVQFDQFSGTGLFNVTSGQIDAVITYQFDFIAVPEPSTYLLFGIGILAIFGLGYRQRKKAA